MTRKITDWEHLDGTVCTLFTAGRPAPRGGGLWWCTEHQQHVVVPIKRGTCPGCGLERVSLRADGSVVDHAVGGDGMVACSAGPNPEGFANLLAMLAETARHLPSRYMYSTSGYMCSIDRESKRS